MGLEATVPADKIYAPCGILKLKNISYNVNHSSDEAFQVVVGELVKRGRLAWLYALPPILKGESIQLSVASMAPFVLPRLGDAFFGIRNEMHLSSTSLDFPVLLVGKITQTKLLAEVLQEMSDWMQEHDSMDFPLELAYLFFAPKIIRRIALDLVNPLLVDPLFGEISQELGITLESGSRPTRAWKLIMSLYTKDVTSRPPRFGGKPYPEDLSAATLVSSAARSLKVRLRMVQHKFLVIWWCSQHDDKIITIGLGPQT